MKNLTIVLVTVLVVSLVSCKAGKKSTPNYGKLSSESKIQA